MNSDNKKKYAFWMRPSMVETIESMLPEANADSKSEFVRMAVEFFVGYLRSKKTVNYMAPIIAGTIKSEIRSVEKNLSEMIFKLAVE